MMRFVLIWDESQAVVAAAKMLYCLEQRFICKNKGFAVHSREEYESYMRQFIEEHPGMDCCAMAKDKLTALLMQKESVLQELQDIEEMIQELDVKGITYEPDAG